MGDPNFNAKASLSENSTAPAELYSSGQMYYGGSLANNQTTDFRSQREKSSAAFMYAIPNTMVGAFASIAESLPGTSDEGVDTLIKKMTPEGMYQDYSDKKAGYALAGGLVAAVPVIFAVPKLMRAKSLYSKVESVAGEKAARVLLPNKYSVSDRVKEFKEKVAVSAKKQTNTFTQETTQEINSAIKKNTRTEFFDMMKIGLTTDAAIYATQNNNEFLFPEEMSAVEIGAFYGLPNLVIAGAAGAVVRYQMKNILRDAGELVSQARNVGGVPVNEATSVPGYRDISATNNFLMANSKTNEMQKAMGDAEAVKNISAQEVAYGNQGMEQVRLMGTDDPFPGITKKFVMEDGAYNTVNAARKADPTVLGDTKSIQSGSQSSIEKTLKGYESRKNLLSKEIEELDNLLELNPNKDMNDKAFVDLINQLADKKNQHDELLQLDFIKLHPDGSMESADGVKDVFNELLTGKVKKVQGGTIKDHVKSTHVGDLIKWKPGKKDVLDTPDAELNAYAVKYSLNNPYDYVTATSDFSLQIPRQINQGLKDIKQVVDGAVDARESFFRQSLFDIGRVYHYRSGQLGKKLFDTYSLDAKIAIRSWTVSSESSVLRETTAKSGKILNELYEKNKVVRQSFKEIADADGLIPAFRGETISSSAKPYNDVVSMTFSPGVAKDFAEMKGTHVVAVRIDPADIVAVVGGAGDEFEIIVKGNLKRTMGDTITKETYERLTPLGKSAAQSVLKHSAATWTPNAPQVNLNVNAHHTQLDSILEVVGKYGGDSPEIIKGFKLPKDTSWEDIELLSLQKKYVEYVSAAERMGTENLNIIKLPESAKTTLNDLIRNLNLPNNGVGGMTPLIQLFEDKRLQGVSSIVKEFPNTTVLRKEIENYAFPAGDLTENYVIDGLTALRGTQFTTYNEKRSSLLLVTKPTSQNLMQKADLIEATMLQRAEIVDGLKKGHPLIKAAVDIAMRDMNRFKAAKAVDTIVEGSRTWSDRATQAMFGVDNQPTIKAMDSIRDEWENATKAYIAKQFEPHNKTYNQLISNKAELDYFAIARHQDGIGWRGTPNFVPVMDGDKLVGYKIALEKHETNIKMAKDYYDIDMVAYAKTQGEDMYMPTPKLNKDTPYAPLVVPPLAAKALMSINEMSQDVRKVINTLRESTGMKPLSQKAFHLVPKNIAAQEKKYLINQQTGELYSIAPGNTANQAAALAAEEVAIAKRQGVDLFVASAKEIEQYSLLQLNDPTKMIDYSTSFRQKGGMAKGTSFGQTIELGAFVLQEQQESLIRQYMLASRVSSAIIFDPEFRAAKLAASTSGMNPSTLAKGTNNFETYIRRGLGAKSGNEKQTIGKFYGAVEDIYDRLWQKAWDQKLSVSKGGQTVAQSESGFKNLDDSIGPEYNPFKDSVEYLENTMQIKPPQNMLKHMSTLSAITGANLLRMGEIGLGVINIMSLPTLIPVVARALLPAKGQDIEEWKKLNAAWSSEIKEGEALWNPIRASTSGTHYFFSKEGQQLMKDASAKGHLWQKAVEQLQLFTSPTQGYWQRMVSKGTDKASIIVDKTEEWSRGISYATFYKLGKENLKLDKDAAMEFAHHMANRVIGDFRPNNRPQIFQGAAGMPFGLFTTFAWNYMQRVFGYMEKGDFKTFFYQMGLQSAFFGAKSLPGFNQYVEHFSDNYDGTENMVDRMQSSLGTEVTDAILFGSVGSLTGLAAYSRTEIGLPGSNFARTQEITSMMPAAGMIKRAYQGISESIDSMKANDGLNGRELMEIAGRTFPTSSVKGWIQTGLGQTVDSRGQLINENIDTAVERFAKISNIKTLREQLLVEEFARTRSTEMKWKSLRARARKALRASYRSGKLTNDTLNGIAKDFLASNGQPDDFDNFLTGEIEAALVNKGYLKALTHAKQVSQQDQMMRMINILGNKDYE